MTLALTSYSQQKCHCWRSFFSHTSLLSLSVWRGMSFSIGANLLNHGMNQNTLGPITVTMKAPKKTLPSIIR